MCTLISLSISLLIYWCRKILLPSHSVCVFSPFSFLSPPLFSFCSASVCRWLNPTVDAFRSSLSSLIAADDYKRMGEKRESCVQFLLSLSSGPSLLFRRFSPSFSFLRLSFTFPIRMPALLLLPLLSIPVLSSPILLISQWADDGASSLLSTSSCSLLLFSIFFSPFTGETNVLSQLLVSLWSLSPFFSLRVELSDCSDCCAWDERRC